MRRSSCFKWVWKIFLHHILNRSWVYCGYHITILHPKITMWRDFANENSCVNILVEHPLLNRWASNYRLHNLGYSKFLVLMRTLHDPSFHRSAKFKKLDKSEAFIDLCYRLNLFCVINYFIQFYMFHFFLSLGGFHMLEFHFLCLEMVTSLLDVLIFLHKITCMVTFYLI